MQQWRMVSPPAVGVAGVLLLAVAMMTEVTAARGLKVLKTPVHHLLALPLWQSHSQGQCPRLCDCSGMLRRDVGKPDRNVRRGRTGSGRGGVYKLVALAKRS